MSTARRWIDAASFRLACGIGGIVQAAQAARELRETAQQGEQS